MIKLTIRIFLVFLVFSPDLFSQGMSVRSFLPLNDDNDAAINYPMTDQNGDTCAIIKIITSQRGISFDGDALGIIATEEKEDGYWVYLPHGAKRLTVMHEKLGILRGYVYSEEIKSSRVYQIILNTRDVRNVTRMRTLNTQFVTIISQPDSANVFINEIHQGQTPFQMIFPEGDYSYKVVKNKFKTESGKFTLNSSSRKEISSVLDNNTDSTVRNEDPEIVMKVTIESDPSISEILINNEIRGKTPATLILNTGTYQIRLSKDGYSYEGRIEITPGGKTLLFFHLKESINNSGISQGRRIMKEKTIKNDFFTELMYGTEGYGIRNFGFMIANVSAWGWFLQFEYYSTNVRNEIKYRSDAMKLVDYSGNGYYIFDNNISNYRIGGTIGIVRKVDLVNLYLGCGYGISDIFWHIKEYNSYDLITSEAWVRNLNRSFNGFELSTGLIFRLNKFNITAGINSLYFKQYEAKVGFGISW